MSLPKRNPRRRPHQTPFRRTISAIGLGIGITGVGVTIGELYRRPSIAIGSVVLGVGLAAIHMPWKHFMEISR